MTTPTPEELQRVLDETTSRFFEYQESAERMMRAFTHQDFLVCRALVLLMQQQGIQMFNMKNQRGKNYRVSLIAGTLHISDDDGTLSEPLVSVPIAPSEAQS